jgi:hypothetical protein
MLMAFAANAANIEAQQGPDLNTITIVGRMVSGDYDTFGRIADSMSGTTVVVLSSKGGMMVDSVNIGQSIRRHGFGTAVIGDDLCASSCGLIWLAGKPRFASGTAKIGFHAVYVGEGDEARESGVGNALVGAYLNKLGLSYDAVAFITSAAPDDLNFLHGPVADRLGINFVMLRAPASQPATGSGQTAIPAGSPAERQAMGIMLAYFALWSGSNADVNRLAPYYGDPVRYYGNWTPLAKVMEVKRAFSARWPIRTYTVRRDSLTASCPDNCTVTGVVEWNTVSAERNVRSLGSASFAIVIALNGSPAGGTILSENGAVLSGRKGH